ncbi:ANK [Mytilus edulis]|uniref:ANK n=1 Tax=Mytilus edulis TaxID=6550 RepID=A0A8S3S4R8_MYTED|nr:ANK [Mytilus edulis]
MIKSQNVTHPSPQTISNFVPDKGEDDENIATYRANEKPVTEGKQVASDADEQELKDNFMNLKTDILKVPFHIKVFQDETLEDWERKLNKIVITRAIEFIHNKILNKNVIVITGPTGSGKSAIAYYVAFRLQKESSFTIIPTRHSEDITNYYVQGTKQVFIIDDFIGKYAVDETNIDNADINIQDKSGCTPLHLASNSAVAKVLLDYNANINSVDAFGRSPVYLACSTNQEKVLALLIEKNAEINQKTKTGLRPLHAACQSGSSGIVNMLIKKGAKINRSEPGITPLHEACKNACKNERISAVQILLDNEANVNEADKHGWTALFFSCARGCRAIVDVLLQHDANVNICDEDTESPLILACKEEYTDVVDLLLSSKANVNACDKDNCSSLLVACKTGNVDLVSLLLKYSADINLANKNMITPLHAACMNNNNIKLVLKLVENNANVNAADKNGQTPLFKSIVNGYNDIVDILLCHGAFIDMCDTYGLSPVAIANIAGNTTVIDALRQQRPINKID